MYWNKRANKNRRRMQQYTADNTARLAGIADARVEAKSTRIEAQCARAGFGFHWIDSHRLLTGPYHYNSSILRVGDAIWFATRRQRKTRESDILLAQLDESLQPIPESNKVLVPEYMAEDPRLFWFKGAPWMSFSAWRGVTSTAWVDVCELDLDANVVRSLRIEHGGNWSGGVVQKNWLFFEHAGELMLIYQSAPEHEVLRVDPTGTCEQVGGEPGLRWKHGVIRGGTPPVPIGDRYYSFFHSRGRLEAHGRYTYFMGAYSFEAKPPFKPLAMTPVPLLHGSDEDENLSSLPLVVFPCGAILIDGPEWVVSVGVNDVATGIVSIKHEDLLKLLVSL